MRNVHTHSPLISVIIPVYNAAPYLNDAIWSIINQTYQNWELILVDDCSTDGSRDIIKKYARFYPNISAIMLKKHAGVAHAANKALARARGQFVARLDADDVALPERLEQQLRYLCRHPDVIIVGGQCQVINRAGHVVGAKRFPTDFATIMRMIFHYYPLQQPATMVNRALLPARFHWYLDSVPSAEEHELLFRLLKYGKAVNLGEYVIQYRLHGNNISFQKPRRDFYFILNKRLKAIFTYGYRPPLKSIALNIAQLVVVTLVPEKVLMKLYSKMRGLPAVV